MIQHGTKEKKAKTRRGFAAMDPAKASAISSLGGKAGHRKGTAHEWDSSEAREAGRKGGVASGISKRAKLAAARAA